MYEREFLLWACDAATAPLDDAAVQYDENRLLLAIRDHRVSGRFLHRIERDRPMWASEAVVTALREQQQEVTETLDRQLSALDEIHDTFAPDTADQHLLLIKGVTAYALIDMPYARRFSRDVDILTTNLDALLRALSQLGYAGSKRLPGPHEVGAFSRDAIKLDVHRHFPAWGFLDSMKSISLVPAENPGIWVQGAEKLSLSIELEDLLRHSTVPAAPEVRNFIVPNPTMAVLIHCTHILKHYCWNMFTGPRAAFRLAELVEVRDLTRHAAFDRPLFATLVSQFRGEDAVAFVGRLLDTLFGDDPFLHVISQCPIEWGVRFPIRLWHGFWAILDWSLDDLLLPIPQQMTSRFVRQLGENRVVARREGERQIYAALTAGVGQALERVLVRQENGFHLPLTLSVTWDEDALTFSVSVKQPISGHRERIRFNFGDFQFCEWVYEVEQQESYMINLQGEPRLTVDENGYTLEMRLSWDQLHIRPLGGEVISMLLGVSRQDAHIDQEEATLGTLIPLNIILDQ